MEFVNIYDAKTNFSKYIEKAGGGDQVIVICKNGEPVCQLSKYTKTQGIKLGLMKGRITMAEDFDAPLPNEIIGDYLA